MALEEQIQVLKTSTENSLCSTASQKESAHQAARLQIEKEFQEKFDQLERDNEKLTKEMLKHMRRAEELSRTVDEVTPFSVETLVVIIVMNLYIWIVLAE